MQETYAGETKTLHQNDVSSLLKLIIAENMTSCIFKTLLYYYTLYTQM